MPQDVGPARDRARAAARRGPGARARRGRGDARGRARAARGRRDGRRARWARRSASGRSSAATSSRASGTPPAGGSSARARRGRRPPGDHAVAAASASGSCSTLLFASDADVLLLDEPDNFLDVPAKRELEAQIRDHEEDGAADQPRPRAADRARATRSSRSRATARGCTASPTPPTPPAREHRQELHGRPRRALEGGGARLRELVRLFKERAQVRAGLGQARQRDGDALEALGRRGPAARARRRPHDQGAPARRRQRPARRRAARRGDRRARAPVQRGGPLRRAHRARRAQRLGQDAPHPPARRARRSATTATSCSARACRPGLFTQLNARADFAGAGCSTSCASASGALEPRDAGPGPLRPGRGGAALLRDAQRRPARAPGDPLPRARGPQPAAARRADRQPRHRVLRGARAGAGRLRGHGRRGLARPRLPAHARPLPAARPRRRRRALPDPDAALEALGA